MKIYYLNESNKMLIILNVAIILFVSLWLIALYFGKNLPMWTILLLSALFIMDIYVIITNIMRKRLISKVKENIIFTNDEIVFDEPVDIEIGYCYNKMYTRIYKYKERYYFSVARAQWNIDFKVSKKLKGVVRLQLPKKKFFANTIHSNMNVSYYSIGDFTFPLKFVKRKFIKYFYAPAIRVTTGKYKNLFIIIFDNNFKISVNGNYDNFQIVENGIIFYNDTDNKCKLIVQLHNTYEGRSYIVKPGETLNIQFFPKEPFVILTHYYRKDYSTISKMLDKEIPGMTLLGSGSYEIIANCDNKQSKLSVIVKHISEKQD